MEEAVSSKKQFPESWTGHRMKHTALHADAEIVREQLKPLTQQFSL